MSSQKFKTKEEVEQAYSTLNTQYNTLLDKNQNDLIKIRQKQKTFNQTIQALKSEKEESDKKYQGQIDTLMLQMDKLKHGLTVQVSTTQQKNDINAELVSSQKQVIQLKTLIDLKAERIDHLQENVRKMMDENITLTERAQRYKTTNKTLETKVRELQLELQQIKIKLKEEQTEKASLQESKNKQVKKMQEVGIVTEGDFIVSKKQHEKLIHQFNDQIQRLTQQSQQAEKQTHKFKERLKQTNQQLKRFMERDKKNNAIIKKKNEEIANFERDMEVAMKKTKGERKRINTEQSCAKCKQLEQETKLLKQMVKSLQTMVRVREMETERYKNRENREALNNSKVHDQQARRSRGQLPPLKKNH